jgi:hypothetical protein
VSSQCKDFIKKCLSKDPAHRPTVKDLLEDPYLLVLNELVYAVPEAVSLEEGFQDVEEAVDLFYFFLREISDFVVLADDSLVVDQVVLDILFTVEEEVLLSVFQNCFDLLMASVYEEILKDFDALLVLLFVVQYENHSLFQKPNNLLFDFQVEIGEGLVVVVQESQKKQMDFFVLRVEEVSELFFREALERV